MDILPVLVPSLIALFASFIGYVLLRKTGKETNDTNAFKVVTDQLFKLNEGLTEKLSVLEKKVTDLEADKASKAREKQILEDKLDAVEEELSDLRVVNGALGRYLGKLIRLWPVTVTMPEPDEPVTWT